MRLCCRFVFAAAACWMAGVMGTMAQDAAKPTAAAAPTPPNVPEAWLPDWRKPPMADRPLQIVHGIPPERASLAGMQYYKDLGLGGIVCNVAFDQYMRSDAHWKTLIDGVDACAKLGMVVWLYDEDGYPSGSAGGLVLAENRDFEALALAYDPTKPEPFIVRPSYEHTHASNNYAWSRRYINLLDEQADAAFIRQTHDAYWQHLKEHFGHAIEAVFTDEPSLMAINLGPLPEEVRKKVRVADPVDPSLTPLPSVPWSRDLVERYQERYHQDLNAQRRSLFEGDSSEDRQIRRQFWTLVADLTAKRYYGQIQAWCGEHHVASSGHTLWEENLLHHVPLDGNKLKVLGNMDIPGMDLLTSNPEAVIHSCWLTAGMPFSAALLHGRRRVMTEVSDFSERMSKKGDAPLDNMRATAAWQAAWGVTEFTLYYSPKERAPEVYQAYGEFVGRLNAILKKAQPSPEVLLYYPITDIWAEYRPVAEPLRLTSQSPRVQKIVGDFSRLGQSLQRSQNPFVIVDDEALASAKIEGQASLGIAGHSYTTVVLPEGVELSAPAAAVLDQFQKAGGRVLADNKDTGKQLDATALKAAIQPEFQISPPSEKVALGRFERNGRTILLLVNVGQEPYNGHLVIRPRTIGADDASQNADWARMDPVSGSVAPLAVGSAGDVAIALAGRQTVLLVSP